MTKTTKKETRRKTKDDQSTTKGDQSTTKNDQSTTKNVQSTTKNDHNTTKDDQNATKRFTKQRQAILETLKNTYVHPDANWIYKKVSKKLPNISLGTIYRNLNILAEESTIKELTIQPNVTRYEGNLEPHHHIVCFNCYKIEDISKDSDCEIDEKLKNKFAKKMKYADLSCEILITGLCPDCQSSQNGKE